jgi:hypothetical protein
MHIYVIKQIVVWLLKGGGWSKRFAEKHELVYRWLGNLEHTCALFAESIEQETQVGKRREYQHDPHQ